jgi:hypothetical protein
MSMVTREHVQQLVEQLSLLDQARRLEYLAPALCALWSLHGQMSTDEILADYADLERDDMLAALTRQNRR